ncbi:hypothetical protein AVEN_121013-1 [Araneus ventricosus]|uniref:Uncharacterized protein n=1 Tax=Araneus ventricosus TaxID=182803 RepID=A0A4Y1ZMX1_ARAVE|nr:hypothetical protein AVEN_6536-1 [Araneus ventricosus]GBL58619.1 hypothetical protein AVEN_272681-1 [Araneus ventricosus]GBL58639.1 hypothetical protein AVEN_28513-1 [Araneus ventricosus]GBL58700.1 hypothetical protein AVEN_121013-1 [Araneus ventricosus]
MVLGLLSGFKTRTGLASLFKSTSVEATRSPFRETFPGKSVTAYLNFPETSGTAWIRHSNLAGLRLFSLAITERNFECSALAENKGISSLPVCISFFSMSIVEVKFCRNSWPIIQGSVVSAT